MKAITNLKLRSLKAALLLSLMLGLLGNVSTVSAHGGEDHGDEKPKTATTDKGTVSHTSRLGGYEIMLKHPALEPDTATSARFFVTKFETNEAAENAAPAIEFESANGAVTQAEIEKTDAAGSFLIKIPALPEGDYTIRAKLTYGGETDTATFSGVEVSHAAETAGAGNASSWFGTSLLFLTGAIVLGLFAGLFYWAWQMAGKEKIGGEEAVSA